MMLRMVVIFCLFFTSSILVAKNAEHVFTNIYKHGVWGRDAQGRGISGSGSTLQEGGPFVRFVQDFLTQHSIDSVEDLGCGDWVLGREIHWGSTQYLGLDVVPFLVERNQAAYGTDHICFKKFDAMQEELPSADLFICKDVLQHLPNQGILRILQQLKRYKYCILINDIGHPYNVDTYVGGYRCLQLTKAPFFVRPSFTTEYVSGNNVKQIVLITNM